MSISMNTKQFYMNLDRLKLVADSSVEALKVLNDVKDASAARDEASMSAINNISRTLRELRDSLEWDVEKMATPYGE